MPDFVRRPQTMWRKEFRDDHPQGKFHVLKVPRR
jgi:hypothetical protein